jgi:hypothetical protein
MPKLPSKHAKVKTFMSGGSERPPDVSQGLGSTSAEKTAVKIIEGISTPFRPMGVPKDFRAAQRKGSQIQRRPKEAEARKRRDLADRSKRNKR